MNIKLSVVLMLLFMANSSIYSQNDSAVSSGYVSIISSRIYFSDTVTVGYEVGKTKIYPPRKILIRKFHYSGKLTIKLNGEDFVIKEPIILRCVLPNNISQKIILNKERASMTTEQFYDFTFDIYSDDKLRGWATLELDKTDFNGELDNQKEKNIRYDKTTVFIE